MTRGSSIPRGDSVKSDREVHAGPIGVDKCTDTQDDTDGKYITIQSAAYTDSVYECSLPQHVSTTHAVLFIDYLGGIYLSVHVRTCDISAS